jgi:hypothetical protein
VVGESDVPQSVSRSEWLDLFLKIERGKAVVIPHEKAPVSSVREAVKRLKESGRLPPHYQFLSRKLRDGAVVSYVINSTSGSRSKHRLVRSRAKQSRINEKEVRRLILDKASSEYENSLPEIQTHFYGKPLSSRDDRDEYHRSYRVTRKAREQIEKELGGKFVEELRNDGSKVYRLKK